MHLALRLLTASILPLALGGCFLMPGATTNGAAAPGNAGQSGGPTPTSGSESPSPSTPAAGGTSAPDGPAKPQPVSMSVDMKNECSKTVHLFIGEKPGFSSGRSTTLGSNTLSSEGRGFDGTLTIWVTDDHDNGLSSVKVSPSQRKAIIGSDCTSIHAE